MARTRKNPQPEQMTEVVEVAEVAQATSVGTDNTRRMKMPLSPEDVRAIYAKRRTKGLYDTLLTQFIESGDNGVSVKEQWPELNDKKAQSLKQGFENSKSRKGAPEGSDQVDVIVDGEDVYLINKVVAGIEAEVAEALA
jgi:hypothetical protein